MLVTLSSLHLMTSPLSRLDPASIRHIVFDLDHTLWDYDRNSSLTLADLFGQYELQRLGVDLDQFVAAFKVANEFVWQAYSRQEIHKWQLRNRRFELMEEQLGWSAGTLPIGFGQTYLELCPQQPHLMDGAMEMLDKLHGKYDLHILTNGFADTQHTKLKSGGIHHYFKHIITSEKLRAAKPKPEIFMALMEVAKAEPGTCLMIGDNPEADVWGAQQVGWQAVHYAPAHDQSQLSNADAVLTHWDQLPSFLGL